MFNRLLPFLDDSLHNIYIQGGGVGEVPEPGLVGHHVIVVTILLPVGWFTQVDLFKLQQVTWLKKSNDTDRNLTHVNCDVKLFQSSTTD